ncbi:MAG: AraC family transcriptional regulator [Verrucomicrobiaceae bacterium]|nr:MAG: AraC family transcriptional regulator [Verrucomicrobiaceae bacterium]
MAIPTFDEFRRDALARGCDEALERQWGPGQVLPSHTHPFTAQALVVQGEMWLDERRLLPGDTFHLPAGTPHSERYGPEGATYWVGRRNA